jgi:hypothetical protein
MMRSLVILAVIVIFSGSVVAQTPSAAARAQELAASFNKFKSMSKTKYGITKQKYKDIHCEALVRQSANEYAGVYEASDLGYAIDVRVGSDGVVTGVGYANGSVNFTLENGRIEAGLLSATKAYQNGTREKFEGVFITRTDKESPTDRGVTTVALGVHLTVPVEINGLTYDRLFYQLR